jgi:flagellar biosynthesis GTPase FlhF
MTTLTVQAADTATAMDQIVEKLGADAMILSTTKRNGKVIMKATNDSPERFEVPILPQSSVGNEDMHLDRSRLPNSFGEMFSKGMHPSRSPDGLPAEHIQLSAQARATAKSRAPLPENESTGKATAASTISAAAMQSHDGSHSVVSALQSVTKRIANLEDTLSGMMITESDGLNPELQASTAVQLKRAGYDSTIISRLRPAYAGLPYEAGITAFLDMLGGELSALYSESIMKKRILYVVGATGSGRTTLAAKLAAALKGMHPSKEIALASLNNAQTELDSKLKNFSRILNLPTTILRPDIPIQNFDKMTDFDMLVIDVCLPAEEAIEHIRKAAAHLGESQMGCLLSIPGGTSSKMIELTLKRFASVHPTVALTKLDECETGAAEFSMLANYQARIGILSGTRAVIDALAFATDTILGQYLKENFNADGHQDKISF